MAAPRKRLKSAPKLTDLPDELGTHVLSYFDSLERSKLRRVCRRLKSLVDVMAPPPGIALEIRLVPTQEQAGHPWTVTWDSSTLIVKLDFKVPTSDKTSWLLSDFPVLRMIRPTRLRVESAAVDAKLQVRLLRHLAVDVGSTVTNLSVINLCLAGVIEL